MALGFERMAPGSLTTAWRDREGPLQVLHAVSQRAEARIGQNHGPNAPRMFSNAAHEYFKRYGGNIAHLAKIGAGLARTEFHEKVS